MCRPELRERASLSVLLLLLLIILLPGSIRFSWQLTRHSALVSTLPGPGIFFLFLSSLSGQLHATTTTLPSRLTADSIPGFQQGPLAAFWPGRFRAALPCPSAFCLLPESRACASGETGTRPPASLGFDCLRW